MTKSLKEDPKLAPIHEKLIVERNRKMVSTVEEYLRSKGTYFVVVGAGHLTGEKGILEALREKGTRSSNSEGQKASAGKESCPLITRGKKEFQECCTENWAKPVARFPFSGSAACVCP